MIYSPWKAQSEMDKSRFCFFLLKGKWIGFVVTDSYIPLLLRDL